VFIAIWGLLIYNPLCHWVWASDGFLFNMGAAGAIDFAGRYGGAYFRRDQRPGGGDLSGCPAWFSPHWHAAEQSGDDYHRRRPVVGGLVRIQRRQQRRQQFAYGASLNRDASGGRGWGHDLDADRRISPSKATALGFGSGVLAGLVAVTPAAGVVQPGGHWPWV